MVLVSTKNILRKAQKGRYAVAHFNTNNLEFTEAIVTAADKLKAPVIIATSAGAIKYAGIQQIASMIKIGAAKAKVPVALHLDHSPGLGLIKNCVKEGWTSVMIDASHNSFNTNVRRTRQAVQFCRRYGVPVEAELGQLGGEEGWVKGKNIFTNPVQAKAFVKKTKCDSLAVAIGTSHGAYKFKGNPKLDLQRLKEIREMISIPLVLHGASSVPKDLIRKANKLGARIKGAAGVPDTQIKKAIKLGICKVNTDTDLRLAFNYGVRKFLKKNPSVIDPRKALNSGKIEIQKIVEKKIRLLGSAGKA
ncbi:MAG: class II fructose-1,6-bisphosphate aldolase [Nanoarchaeota archaeon]|nr:class II fructose-1,6-bisphosphate aldolase [Nanoarchaeota archaeon]